jgi:4-carboxymuconolactone decarboxylase
MSLEQRRQQGAELIERMLGPQAAQEVRQAWRGIAPEFEGYVVEFVAGEVWSRPGLDLRTRSLVTIAALAALGRSRALELNLRMAVNNGATRQEITETLLQIAPYAGFPAAWEALAVAEQVLGPCGVPAAPAPREARRV